MARNKPSLYLHSNEIMKAIRIAAVFYSCPECGIVNRRISLKPIEDKNLDAETWVRKVISPAIEADHLVMNPNCCSDKIREIRVQWCFPKEN